MQRDKSRIMIYGLLTMLGLLGVLCFARQTQAAASGYCGGTGNTKSVMWNYADGVLTISGQGRMRDYAEAAGGRCPWYDQRKEIEKVVVEEGVTYIGSNAFVDHCYVKQVVLPQGLQGIGAQAFRMCMRLTHIDLPDGLESIGISAFACTSLTRVVIPGSVHELSAYAMDSLLYDANNDWEYLDGILDQDERHSVVILSEGVRKLDFQVFRSGYYIQTLYFPSTMEDIKESQENLPWDFVNAIYGKNDYVKQCAEAYGGVYVDATKEYDIAEAVCKTNLYGELPLEPKLSLSYMHGDNEVKLNEGIDYAVTYKTEGKEGTAVVTGLGCYTGTKEISYRTYTEDSGDKPGKGDESGDGDNLEKGDEPGNSDDPGQGDASGDSDKPGKEDASGDGSNSGKSDVSNDNNTASIDKENTGNNLGTAKISLADVSMAPIEDVVYCGIALEPEVKLSYQNIILEVNKDYRVSYYNNLHAGTAMLQIEGMGAYTGERTATFTILPYDVSGLSDILKGKDGKIYEAAYTGKAIRPTTAFRLKAAYQDTISYLQPKEGQDYVCQYRNNKKVGEASIRYSFVGDYTGNVVKRFRIVPGSPKIKSVKRKGSGQHITWKKTRLCDYYEVYRKQGKKRYKKIAKVKGKCSYIDTKAPKNQICYYRITACKKQSKQIYRSAFSQIGRSQ